MLKYPDARGVPMKSSWSPEMMRELLDYLDRNKGETGAFVRDYTTALLGAKQAIENNVPAHLNNDLTPTRVKAKYGRILRDAGSKGKSIRNLWHEGTDALDLLKVPPGVYTEEELAPSRERDRLRLVERNKQRATRLVNHVSEESTNSPSNADLSRIQAAVSTALVKDSPNTKLIEESMDDLRRDIENAVLQRMQDGGISSTQPVVLNADLLNRGLQDLVATLLGCDGSMIQHELSKLSAMYAQQRLPIAILVRALVGAAVTMWTLEPILRGQNEPRYKALVAALENADPTAATVLCGQATRNCLEKEFTPNIPENARTLADKLDLLLSIFLCPPASSPDLIEDAVEFRDPVSRSSSAEVYSLYDEDGESLPGSTMTVGRMSIPPWVTQWKHELRGIFEQALHLRVGMEIMGGRYEFFFPRPGSTYSTTPSTRRLITSADPDKFVMLALLPRISGSFQSTPGGSYGSWQVITAAQVSAFKRG